MQHVFVCFPANTNTVVQQVGVPTRNGKETVTSSRSAADTWSRHGVYPLNNFPFCIYNCFSEASSAIILPPRLPLCLMLTAGTQFKLKRITKRSLCERSVSYTHLDVYKRQAQHLAYFRLLLLCMIGL